MTLDIFIVQHADKVRLPGNHGLTELGRRQAVERGESDVIEHGDQPAP